MAEYLIQDTTLTNLGNKIRVLSGSQDAMTPAVMASNVETFCNDIDTELSAQDTLIADIITALDGKTAGSGGSTSMTASFNDVNFRDYDGTILYSYSADEALALTAMPELPTQKGLTCQGWNWSFENMQSYVGKYGRCEIGATYITDDGKTRIYIHLEEGRTSPMLGVCPNGTVTVDWGDGTTPDTLTGTSVSTVVWTPTHNYMHSGDYIIILTIDGSMGFHGTSTTDEYSCILRYSSSADTRNYVYRNSIRKIEIGSSVDSINDYAFSSCRNLKNITIPKNTVNISKRAFDNCSNLTNFIIHNNITQINDYIFYNCQNLTSVIISDSVKTIAKGAFNNCYNLSIVIIPNGINSIESYIFTYCYNLSSIIIPDSVTYISSSAFGNCSGLTDVTIPNSVQTISGSFNTCNGLSTIVIPYGVETIGGSTFQYCYNLTSITIPNSVTSIGTSAMRECYSLATIVIPNSVTSIGNSAFRDCYGLSKLRFNSTTPPTVSSSNAFTGIPADCVISVPTGTLAAYTSATNYPSSSTYTYIEED